MLKKLLTMALPIMATNLLHTFYNLVDSYFLGKLGKEALAAPSIAFVIILILIVFGSGFSAAGTTLISQAWGAGDDKKANFFLGQITLAIIFLSVILTVAGLLLVDPILRLLQVPRDLTFEYTKIYLIIIFSGIPQLFIMFLLRGAFQGVGDTFTPLIIQVVTVGLNILLDWIFIFGIGPFPAWGVAGAATATVISRTVAAVLGILLLIRGRKGLRLQRKNLKPHGETQKNLCKIGLPSSLGQALSILGFSVLQGLVNTLGSAVIAVFGMGNRIIALFNMPAQGITQATTVLVGQSLGAKNPEEARRVVHRAVASILTFITPGMIFIFFRGDEVIRLFIDDAEVIVLGRQMFRILASSVIAFSLQTVLLGPFQAGGHTKPIMYINIIRLWGLRVPLAYFLILLLGWGPLGLWWSMVVSNFAVAFMAVLLYRKGSWARTIESGTPS